MEHCHPTSDEAAADDPPADALGTADGTPLAIPLTAAGFRMTPAAAAAGFRMTPAAAGLRRTRPVFGFSALGFRFHRLHPLNPL